MLAAKWPLEVLAFFQFSLRFSSLLFCLQLLLVFCSSFKPLWCWNSSLRANASLLRPFWTPYASHGTLRVIFSQSPYSLIHALLTPFICLEPLVGHFRFLYPFHASLRFPDDGFNIIIRNVLEDRLGYVTSHSRSYLHSHRRQNLKTSHKLKSLL
jgi:hypothetical protein